MDVKAQASLVKTSANFPRLGSATRFQCGRPLSHPISRAWDTARGDLLLYITGDSRGCRCQDPPLVLEYKYLSQSVTTLKRKSRAPSSIFLIRCLLYI
jgi:hypothetical protein